MSRTERFSTEALVVSGNSPSELEAAAISRASELTGIDAPALAIAETYRIYAVAESEGLDDSAVSLTVRKARESGHRLGARIYVIAFREVNGADTCGVDGDSGVPADTPDLQPAADRVQDG
jgi:hypothetical protein